MGLSVLAVACAIGALPKPASLEKMPRATPNRIAAHTVAPRKPPVAEIGVKAWETIKLTAAGTWSILIKIATTPPPTYRKAIKGTKRPARSEERWIPPTSTNATNTRSEERRVGKE